MLVAWHCPPVCRILEKKLLAVTLPLAISESNSKRHQRTDAIPDAHGKAYSAFGRFTIS
jgi:hypothetical protein